MKSMKWKKKLKMSKNNDSRKTEGMKEVDEVQDGTWDVENGINQKGTRESNDQLSREDANGTMERMKEIDDSWEEA